MTKTLNLTQATARQVFEMSSRYLRIEPTVDRGKGDDPALKQVILDLSLPELQELAAIAWLGGSIFEDFDVALEYAKVLEKWELAEFLEIAPGFSELDRGMRLLESNAIHLS